MKIRYHLIFLLFFTILLSKNSFGWCEDSVRIVVERYCDLCEPRYETIFYYDSIGQLENETYLKWDGIAMVNTGRNLYRVSSDSLIREVEGDEWINGAWKISHLNRTIFNNHGLIIESLDSNAYWVNRYQYIRDASDNIIENIRQHWNGNQWINDNKYFAWFDAQSRDTFFLAQTGDSLSWIDNYKVTIHYDIFGNQTLYLSQNWDGTQWLNGNRTTSGFIGPGIDTLIIQQYGNGLNWINASLHQTVFDTLMNKIYVLDQRGNNTLWENSRQQFNSYHDTLIDTDLKQYWDPTTMAWVNDKKTIYTHDSFDRITEELLQGWQNSAWADSVLYLYYYLPNGRIDYGTQNFWDGTSWNYACNLTPYYDLSGNLIYLRNSCDFWGCTSSTDDSTFDTNGVLIHREYTYTSCGGGTDYDYYDYYYNLASGDSAICDSGIATISVASCPGYNYLWSTGETTPSITVSDSGSYTVQIMDSLGNQIYTQPFQVYAQSSASATHAPDSVINICGHACPVIIEPLLAFANYQWIYNDSIPVSSQQNYPNQLVLNGAVLQSGSYRVIVSSPCGIDTSSASIVNFDTLVPSTHISALGDTTFCKWRNVTLSSDSVFDFYRWSPASQTTSDIVVTHSGYYTLYAWNNPNCQFVSNVIHVYVYDSLNANIYAPNGTTFCTGGSASLAINPVPIVEWSTGESTLMINVYNSGAYYAILKDTSGCFDTTNVITMNAVPLPVVSLGIDTTICNNASIILDAGNGFSNYLWQDSSNAQTFLASTSSAGIDTGFYSVTVTTGIGCRGSDSIEVIFDICSGVSSIDRENEFSIYPNPTSNSFTIKNYSSSRKSVLQILNVVGEVVYSEILFGEREYLIRAGLSPGIYFVIMTDEGRSKPLKLVIK